MSMKHIYVPKGKKLSRNEGEDFVNNYMDINSKEDPEMYEEAAEQYQEDAREYWSSINIKSEAKDFREKIKKYREDLAYEITNKVETRFNEYCDKKYANIQDEGELLECQMIGSIESDDLIKYLKRSTIHKNEE